MASDRQPDRFTLVARPRQILVRTESSPVLVRPQPGGHPLPLRPAAHTDLGRGHRLVPILHTKTCRPDQSGE
jgi:hypothetical protein